MLSPLANVLLAILVSRTNVLKLQFLCSGETNQLTYRKTRQLKLLRLVSSLLFSAIIGVISLRVDVSLPKKQRK